MLPSTALTNPPKHLANRREPATFAHCVSCTKPFGVLESVLSWCYSECVAEWGWQLIVSSSDIAPGQYNFYFDSERDAVAFSLQWC